MNKPKKFTAITASVLSVVTVALTAGGCNRMVRPKFTAESPVFHTEDLLHGNNKIYKNFNTDILPFDSDPYQEFLTYYKTDFKQISDKEFYVLNLGELNGDRAIDRKRSCTVYGSLNADNVL